MIEGDIKLKKACVKFYTRNRCHLCEQAKSVLQELQTEWDFFLEEYDIDESDELTEKYGLMIPVVVIDDVEVDYGQINKLVINTYFLERNLMQ